MAHYHTCDRDHLAGSTAQVQTMLLQVPEQWNSKRCSQCQAGQRQAGSFGQNKADHLNRAHTNGHEHPEFASALEHCHSMVFITPITATRKKIKNRTTVTP